VRKKKPVNDGKVLHDEKGRPYTLETYSWDPILKNYVLVKGDENARESRDSGTFRG